MLEPINAKKTASKDLKNMPLLLIFFDITIDRSTIKIIAKQKLDTSNEIKREYPKILYDVRKAVPNQMSAGNKAK
jgi:hypothetical protein